MSNFWENKLINLVLVLRNIFSHIKYSVRYISCFSVFMIGIICSVAFKANFYDQFIKLGIDAVTAHICIISKESRLLPENSFLGGDDTIPWISLSSDLLRRIKSIPHVIRAVPVIQTDGIFYYLNGQEQGWSTIIALDPAELPYIFPGLRMLDGQNHFSFDNRIVDAPMIRRKCEDWEISQDKDRFIQENFRKQGCEMDSILRKIEADFSLQVIHASLGISIEERLRRLNKLLSKKNLVQYPVIKNCQSPDVIEIRDDLQYLLSKQFVDTLRIMEENKRLLSALYSELIIPSLQSVHLNDKMALSLPLVSKKLSDNTIIPIKIAGFVEGMPLYYYNSFVDIRAVRKYLHVSPEKYTACYIRVDNKMNIREVTDSLSRILIQEGANCTMADYKKLGSLHMSTATAFNVGLNIIIALFCIITAIMTANIVLLSLLKRRREIATQLTLGMSRLHITILFGLEIGILTIFSWGLSSLIAYAIILYFHSYGIPGMVFLQGGVLYPDYKILYSLLTLALMIPVILSSSLVPVGFFFRKPLIKLLSEKE